VDSCSEELRVLALSREEGSTGHPSGTRLEEDVLHLFEEVRDPLLRYLLFTGAAAENAEEVVQETFLRLFEHLQKGKSRSNLRGWIFRVAHNLAAKQRRSALVENSHFIEAAAPGLELLVDPSPSPEACA